MPFDISGARSIEDSELARLLLRVKARIDTPHKWCKGKGVSANGARHCLLGALHVVKANEHLTKKAFAALTNAAARLGYHGFLSFNDDPCTTHRDVMRLLDQTIAEARLEDEVRRYHASQQEG